MGIKERTVKPTRSWPIPASVMAPGRDRLPDQRFMRKLRSRSNECSHFPEADFWTQLHNPTSGFSSVKLSPRQALISEQDARGVDQILFIANLFNQFIGKQRDFALQIRGQLAIDFPARIRR